MSIVVSERKRARVLEEGCDLRAHQQDKRTILGTATRWLPHRRLPPFLGTLCHTCSGLAPRPVVRPRVATLGCDTIHSVPAQSLGVYLVHGVTVYTRKTSLELEL